MNNSTPIPRMAAVMNILILLCPIIAFGSFVDAIAGGGV
jgi:hypothetical protein